MTNDENHRSGACPTFFRGCVARAKSSRHGYSDAAYHLMIHLRELLDGEVPDDVIDHMLEGPDAAEQIWRWLRDALPRCMALVPTRRKPSFLRGIIAAIEEGRV